MTKARMMSGARVGVLCGAMSALVTGCTSAADQIDKLCPTMEAARPACEAQAPEMRMSCYVRALHEVASHDEVRAALVGAGDTPPAERYAALQRAFGAMGRPDWQCAPLEELLRPDA